VMATWFFRILSRTLVLFIWPSVTVLAQVQNFQSPQHDARILIGMDLPEQQITKFYDVYYGHNIRLGEGPFYCGDPLFLVHINEVPRLSIRGQFPASGDYSVDVFFSSGLNAKVYETCDGIVEPSAGGDVALWANLGSLSDQDSFRISGEFRMGSFLGFPVFTSPISFDVPIPAKPLNNIPIRLDEVSKKLDFGILNGGVWTSSGTSKDIPIQVSAGAIGKPGTDSSFFVVDATVGMERKKTFSSQDEAVADYNSDFPIQSGENIGVSIKQSFFGKAAPGSQSYGFLGNLLPLRISDEGTYRILFWKKTIKWQAVLDSASVVFTKSEGSDAIEAQVGSTYIRLGKHTLVGKKALKAVSGRILFDNLQNEDGMLHFRVADFRVRVKVNRFLVIRIRLSSGDLEKQLNGGIIPIAKTPQSIALSLPDDHFDPPCVYTGWDKLKADYRACNDADQRIGYLSFERRGSGKARLFFLLEPSSISSPRVVNDALQVGGSITVPE
jgi:hypothetical protein